MQPRNGNHYEDDDYSYGPDYDYDYGTYYGSGYDPAYDYDSGYGGPLNGAYNLPMQQDPQEAYVQFLNQQVAFLFKCVKSLEEQNQQLNSSFDTLRKVLNAQLRLNPGQSSQEGKKSGNRRIIPVYEDKPIDDPNMPKVADEKKRKEKSQSGDNPHD